MGLTPGQGRTAKALLALLGVAFLAGLFVLGWEFYSLWATGGSPFTDVIRLLFEQEPGAFMLTYGVVMLAIGSIMGHLFWCPRCKG